MFDAVARPAVGRRPTASERERAAQIERERGRGRGVKVRPDGAREPFGDGDGGRESLERCVRWSEGRRERATDVREKAME